MYDVSVCPSVCLPACLLPLLYAKKNSVHLALSTRRARRLTSFRFRSYRITAITKKQKKKCSIQGHKSGNNGRDNNARQGRCRQQNISASHIIPPNTQRNSARTINTFAPRFFTILTLHTTAIEIDSLENLLECPSGARLLSGSSWGFYASADITHGTLKNNT